MWNIGKIWLRFFTRAPIRIKYMNQEKIDKIVDESVAKVEYNQLIKKLLTWKSKKRISL
jgi:hypothetical protein